MTNEDTSSNNEFLRGPRDWNQADEDELDALLANGAEHPAFGGVPASSRPLTRRRAFGWSLVFVGFVTLIVLALSGHPVTWLGGLALAALVCGLLLLLATLQHYSRDEADISERDDGAVL